jgi:microsomal dipeptidase-like Zn-dependent dipeptidase
MLNTYLIVRACYFQESEVSHSRENWEQLTSEWADSLKKAKVRQAIIDDKMHSFLKGNGCLPTDEELKMVEQLWEQHVQARNKTNRFIQDVLLNYLPTD